MRIRRWRVVKVRSNDKTGYESPMLRFLTQRAARRCADRLNVLHVEESRGGIVQALNGTRVGPFWCPVRDRELAALRSHHTLKASGSLDRHPAGSLSGRLRGATPPPFQTPATGKGVVEPDSQFTIGRPLNQCELAESCTGPYQLDGHCVHCQKLEKTDDSAPK